MLEAALADDIELRIVAHRPLDETGHRRPLELRSGARRRGRRRGPWRRRRAARRSTARRNLSGRSRQLACRDAGCASLGRCRIAIPSAPIRPQPSRERIRETLVERQIRRRSTRAASTRFRTRAAACRSRMTRRQVIGRSPTACSGMRASRRAGSKPTKPFARSSTNATACSLGPRACRRSPGGGHARRYAVWSRQREPRDPAREHRSADRPAAPPVARSRGRARAVREWDEGRAALRRLRFRSSAAPREAFRGARVRIRRLVSARPGALTLGRAADGASGDPGHGVDLEEAWATVRPTERTAACLCSSGATAQPTHGTGATGIGRGRISGHHSCVSSCFLARRRRFLSLRSDPCSVRSTRR